MRIKKRTAIIVWMLLTDIVSLSAQSDSAWYYRHEISAHIGIGTLSGNRWDAFREQMEQSFALSFRHGYAHSTTPIGVRKGLRYMYSFNKHVAAGGQFSYFSGNLSYEQNAKIQAKAFSVMPTVKWLYSRHFYVRGGIGLQHREYCLDASSIDVSVSSPINDRQWLFAYQFVPLGMEYALPEDELCTLLFKHVSPIYFHAELGYGMEGILNVGIAYKFSSQRKDLRY